MRVDGIAANAANMLYARIRPEPFAIHRKQGRGGAEPGNALVHGFIGCLQYIDAVNPIRENEGDLPANGFFFNDRSQHLPVGS